MNPRYRALVDSLASIGGTGQQAQAQPDMIAAPGLQRGLDLPPVELPPLSNGAPDVSQLRDLIAVPRQRPLDPNGIDVPAEIPVMQRAYAKTDNGKAFKGRGEAGYSIFKSDPGIGRSGFSYGSELHMSIPVKQGFNSRRPHAPRRRRATAQPW